MKPYFVLDGITIYHADCNDVLSSIDPTDVDLLLTDPPYGISWVGPRDGATIVGDDAPFDPAPLMRFGRRVIFGANHFADRLPPSSGWIVWDKTGGGKTRAAFQGEAELAWHNLSGSIDVFRHLWFGNIRNAGDKSEGFVHPTQKPVALMRWILEKWTEPGDLILDPYMGSGPIAQACFELGRRYIGIEIEEQYCQVTVERRFAQRALLL